MVSNEFLLFSTYKHQIRQKNLKLLVSGHSMNPVIREGDIVEVSKITKQLKIYDIVVFRDNNHKELQVHYISQFVRKINDGQQYYITKGVNNKNEDAPFPSSNLLGKVVNYNISLRVKLYIKLFKVFV